MLFILITFLAAFLIEAIGTFVSVIGLSALFSTNPIIIALAVALDIGKLVTVTFLYKNWKKMNFVMKTYMTIASAILMLITSAGAGGYLSAEFQGAIMSTKESDIKVSFLKEEQAKLEARKLVIDTQIAELPKNAVKSRAKLAKQFESELKQVNARVLEIDTELPKLQIAKVSNDSHVGPILYIAEAFKISVEDAVKYVILLIIFVFDPLAITLIIGGNFLLDQRRKEKEKLKIEKERKSDEEIKHKHKLEIEELKHHHEVVDEVVQIENIYSHLGEATSEQKEETEKIETDSIAKNGDSRSNSETSMSNSNMDSGSDRTEWMLVPKEIAEETSETITERDSQVKDIIVENGEKIEETREETYKEVSNIGSEEVITNDWTFEDIDGNESIIADRSDSDFRPINTAEIQEIQEIEESIIEDGDVESDINEEKKTPVGLDQFPEVWSLKDISGHDVVAEWQPQKNDSDLFRIYRKDVVQ